MAMHEIGFLIISGVFQCWFWQGTENTCLNADKITPAGIKGESASQYFTKEVYYEESGFVVFDKKADAFQIRKVSGENTWLNLKDINEQVRTALPKNATETEQEISLWRYVSLDDVLKSGMIGYESEESLQLFHDDLKTQISSLSNVLKKLKDERNANILKNRKLELAIGYITTSTPCKYTKVGNLTQGSCKSPGSAPAYSKPNHQAQKVLDAVFSFGHLKGFPKNDGGSTPNYSEKLFVYEERGEWLRMRLEVFEESKRDVWLLKKDIPYPYTRLKENEQMAALKELVESKEAGSFESVEAELNEKLVVPIESAAASKWKDGILWLKINVRDKELCSGEDHRVLATGWIPYINPKNKKKNIGWAARGC